MSLEADFVVVGAGSAGCALAARLSEDPAQRVIVLEHGGSDAGPLIRMPAALSHPMNMARYDWGYRTEPEPFLGGRRLACPRGKVIGGSSSINGMVYVRGHPLDYDHWERCGASGWSFTDVLPYFLRMESAHGGEPGWRGRDGPLHVTRGRGRTPVHRAFLAAAREAGFAATGDYNGERQEGFGALEMTVWRGRRWSAADAYLKPALSRPNLSLERGLARRVVFEGRRAVGVEWVRDGRSVLLRARREVILCASSINSPKLLLLSGIGPAGHLHDLGIPVLADRPGVGGNLQDHLEVYVQYRCLQPVSLFPRLRPLSKILVGARWLLTRGGDGASNHFESGGFARTGPQAPYPDVQFHFLPLAVRYDGTAPVDGHGFQMHVGPMRSPSRGRVWLRSPDPGEAPAIRFNYMSHPQDWSDFRRCVGLARAIAAQPAFAPYRGAEIAPGEAVRDDDALDAWLRDAVESAYHPCGTCRMGREDDPHAVVDPQCRVIGVHALRVADSSIFPRITNGNLNAPSIMVGEKAADHVLGRAPAAPCAPVPRTRALPESSGR